MPSSKDKAIIEYDKITVTKGGGILGIKRFTETPFKALALADRNMMCPDTSIKKVFKCRQSAKE